MPRSRVLVIDDEPKIRELIQAALSPWFEVLLAANGAEGLERVQAHSPDLILLDMVMPGMDGLGVLAKLKGHQTTSVIPVVIVSAKGDTRMLAEGQGAGALDYLIKPFTVEELRQLVFRYLVWDDAGPAEGPLPT